MTEKEKLEKLRKLADAMYYAAQHLTTDASRLHKAMEDYHRFVTNEYHKEEPTTSVWQDTRSEEPIVGRNIVMWHYDRIYSGEYLGEGFFGHEKLTLMSDSKWAYFEDLKKL